MLGVRVGAQLERIKKAEGTCRRHVFFRSGKVLANAGHWHAKAELAPKQRLSRKLDWQEVSHSMYIMEMGVLCGRWSFVEPLCDASRLQAMRLQMHKLYDHCGHRNCQQPLENSHPEIVASSCLLPQVSRCHASKGIMFLQAILKIAELACLCRNPPTPPKQLKVALRRCLLQLKAGNATNLEILLVG